MLLKRGIRPRRTTSSSRLASPVPIGHARRLTPGAFAPVRPRCPSSAARPGFAALRDDAAEMLVHGNRIGRDLLKSHHDGYISGAPLGRDRPGRRANLPRTRRMFNYSPAQTTPTYDVTRTATHTILIGTSSWTDKTLIEYGRFYPAAVTTPEERLRFCASQFPIVEIDSGYYGIPSIENAERWVDRSNGPIWLRRDNRG